MKTARNALLFVVFLLAVAPQILAGYVAVAQQSITLPATNTPLVGCVNGRSLRVVNNNPACSTGTPPVVSGCGGTDASVSANATDFVGQINTGSALITKCTLTFSAVYPSFGCLAQSNTGVTQLATAPIVTTANNKTTMEISLTLAIAKGKLTYFCAPV